MEQVDSKLVGLIYDAALEPRKWTELLSVLASTESQSQIAIDRVDDRSNSIDSEIQQHIRRAHTFSERIAASQHAEDVTQSIADLLPIPALVLDSLLNVRSSNASYKALAGTSKLFEIKDNVLSSNSNTLMFKLKENIKRLELDQTQDFLTMRVQSAEPSKPISLLISKVNQSTTTGLFMVLVAASQHGNHLSEAMLAQTFGLTKAEQKLSLGIARGESLSDIAESTNVSIHTVRTQLKTVFSKVGVNRQSELMRVLLTSSLLNVNTASLKDTTKPEAIEQRAQSPSICKLKDGRDLAYAEYGDLSGEVVFAFHPTTGSRLQCHPNNEITSFYGVRLILVDRPGFGLSTQQEARTFLSFADDIKELAASLNLRDFSLLGYCGGGPYALACAHSLGKQVKHLTVVSGVTPYDSIDLLHGASTINRLLVKIATVLPDSVFHLASILAKKIVNEPEIYLDELQGDLCESDKAALNEPEFLDNFMLALGESLRQGAGELAREQILFAQPWGFDPASINVSADLWYGDMDRHVPIALSQKLASDMPNANFHIIENYGHFMIYHKWSEILERHMLGLRELDRSYGT